MVLVNASELNLEREEKYDLLYRLELIYSEFLKRKTDYRANDFRNQIKEIPSSHLRELIDLESVSITLCRDHPKLRYTKEWNQLVNSFLSIKELFGELEVKKTRIVLESKKLFSINKIVSNYFYFSELNEIIEEDFSFFTNSVIESLDTELYFYKAITQLYIKKYGPDLLESKQNEAISLEIIKDKNKYLYSWITNNFFFIYCLDTFNVSGLVSDAGFKGILKSKHPLSKKMNIAEKDYLFVNLSLEESTNSKTPNLGDKFIYPSIKRGVSYTTKTKFNRISSYFEIKIKPNGLKIKIPFFLEFSVLKPEEK